ncbi:MAG: glycine betaine/L-proline ABC transporter ATP-binding protein, partial [Pontibacterium sp.]
QMSSLKSDYAYVVEKEEYQGTVTLARLNAIYDGDDTAELTNECFEEVEPLDKSAVLETVIPCTLEADYSLPVLDEDGKLTGRLSRGSISQALGLGASSPN